MSDCLVAASTDALNITACQRSIVKRHYKFGVLTSHSCCLPFGIHSTKIVEQLIHLIGDDAAIIRVATGSDQIKLVKK